MAQQQSLAESVKRIMNWTCAYCETLNADPRKPCEVCGGTYHQPVPPLPEKKKIARGWTGKNILPEKLLKYEFEDVKLRYSFGRMIEICMPRTKTLEVTILIYAAVAMAIVLLMLQTVAGASLLSVVVLLAWGIGFRYRYHHLVRNAVESVSVLNEKNTSDEIIPSEEAAVSVTGDRIFLKNELGVIGELDEGALTLFYQKPIGNLSGKSFFVSSHFLVGSLIEKGITKLSIYDDMPFDMPSHIFEIQSAGSILKLVIDPGGNFLTIFNDLGELWISRIQWNKAGKTRLRTRPGGIIHEITDLAISRDGIRVACLLPDGRIDIRSGNEPGRGLRYSFPHGKPTRLCFMQSGQDLMTGTSSGALYRADTDGNDPELLHVFPLAVSALAFSPDDSLLAVAAGTIVYLWDVAKGKRTEKLKTNIPAISAIVFCNPHQMLVCGCGHLESWISAEHVFMPKLDAE
jgi:hypothetical protein